MGIRVQLAPPSPIWPLAAAHERDRVEAALGELALSIDHFGSTAVPGLPAKPILDLLVGARQPFDVPDLARRLAPLGYSRWIDDGPDHVVFYDVEPRTRNLHVHPHGTREHRRHLAFRDALRADPALRDEYAALKRDLAQREWETVQDYADAKTPFVRRVEKQALGE